MVGNLSLLKSICGRGTRTVPACPTAGPYALGGRIAPQDARWPAPASGSGLRQPAHLRQRAGIRGRVSTGAARCGRRGDAPERQRGGVGSPRGGGCQHRPRLPDGVLSSTPVRLRLLSQREVMIEVLTVWTGACPGPPPPCVASTPLGARSGRGVAGVDATEPITTRPRRPRSSSATSSSPGGRRFDVAASRSPAMPGSPRPAWRRRGPDGPSPS